MRRADPVTDEPGAAAPDTLADPDPERGAVARPHAGGIGLAQPER
jgi:hypothetical protein